MILAVIKERTWTYRREYTMERLSNSCFEYNNLLRIWLFVPFWICCVYFFLHLNICLYIYLPTYIYALHTYLLVHIMSEYLPTCIPFFLSASQSIYSSVSLSLCISINLINYLSTNLFTFIFLYEYVGVYIYVINNLNMN